MVTIGVAIGSPARAAMLDALVAGHALTATELARVARVAPATASTHLEKLLRSGLLSRERHGRHRYFRIAGPEVAEALEVLGRLGAERAAPKPPTSREQKAIHRARLCYDHFAGELGVAMTSAMVDNGWLVPEDRDFQLTEAGETFFAELGIDLDAARSKRRMFARQCLDWSERRPHLAGSLGAALAERAFDEGWVKRTRQPREVEITRHGETVLERHFGFSHPFSSS